MTRGCIVLMKRNTKLMDEGRAMEASTAALVLALEDLDKNVRIRTALALGELADAQTLPALLARFRSEPDFFVRDQLVWSVVRMGAQAVPDVIALLDDRESAVRYLAAHTLSKFADARAVDALQRALDDDDPLVAQKATYALGRIRDVRALPALVRRLGSGSGESRTTLHDALAAFGETGLPFLLPLLETAETAVRVDAVELLGAVGGSSAVALLSRATTDADWEVRFAAVNALGSAADSVARGALESATRDVHAHVRILAARLVEQTS